MKTTKTTAKEIKVSIQGIRPMIMHNGRLADPLDYWAKRIKKLTAERNKTDEQYEELGREEFQGALYYSDELGVYLPSENLQRLFLDAAKKTKQGRQAIAIRLTEPVGYALDFPHSRNLEKLKATPSMHFRRVVGVNGKKVVRVRPLIPTGWRCHFSIELDTGSNGLNPEQFHTICDNAGLYVGLGDWRPGAPKVPGQFGKFIVTHFDGKELP